MKIENSSFMKYERFVVVLYFIFFFFLAEGDSAHKSIFITCYFSVLCQVFKIESLPWEWESESSAGERHWQFGLSDRITRMQILTF